MMRSARRRFLARVAATLALPITMTRRARAQAQIPMLDPRVTGITKGAPLNKGRVKLELPALADNGNSVLLRVSVDSSMSSADYVKSIHLIAEKNPVRNMANFYFGPRAGRAQVATRVRLAGSQTVTAVAAMSDGTFWLASANTVVTSSACLDES